MAGNRSDKVAVHQLRLFRAKGRRFAQEIPIDPPIVKLDKLHRVFRFIEIRSDKVTRRPRDTRDYAGAGAAKSADQDWWLHVKKVGINFDAL
jgi:hypothetical protein